MFCRDTVAGTELNDDTIGEHLERSLMLATALSPEIGYDKADEIAHKASEDGSTLKGPRSRSVIWTRMNSTVSPTPRR